MKRRTRRQSRDEEDDEGQPPRHRRKTSGLSGTWVVSDNECLLTYTPSNVTHCAQIAAFDFDSTLVNQKSGRAFPVNADDWQLLHPSLPQVLVDLARTHRLVIFSNQAGIARGKVTLQALKQRLSSFMEAVLPATFTCYCSIARDSIFRKPATGMWDRLATQNGAIDIDKANSFFVGDAAGRRSFTSPFSARKKPKNDFSCSDRKMALNVNIKFLTPEEFILKQPPFPDWILKGLDIRSRRSDLGQRTEPDVRPPLPTQEMLICIGWPGCGKSSFCRRVLSEPLDEEREEEEGETTSPASEYVRVNRDTLKTIPKCIRVARAALAEGKSVVIDNTNPDPTSRARFMKLATAAGVRCRALRFLCDRALAEHCNGLRALYHGVKRVPAVAYHSFNKRLVEPTREEGFEEIVMIPFVPVFESEEEEERFYQYT